MSAAESRASEAEQHVAGFCDYVIYLEDQLAHFEKDGGEMWAWVVDDRSEFSDSDGICYTIWVISLLDGRRIEYLRATKGDDGPGQRGVTYWRPL